MWKQQLKSTAKLMGDIHLRALLLLLFLVEFTVSYPHRHEDLTHVMPDDPFIKYTYTRFPEIEKLCGFLIPSASELPPDDNRGERMKKDLSFQYGDWVQEFGGAPLMPFDSHEISSSSTYPHGSPLKLVSFWLMDVDPIRRAKNTLSVSGAMDIGIVRGGFFAHKPYNWHPNFKMERGTTELTILFEGIYVESQEDGGQGMMCLLGNATFPTSSAQQIEHSCEHGNPWKSCLLEVNNQPSYLQDDQIMLVLRYPMSFTLSSRGIAGEMKSLNDRQNQTFFDKIHISSQLGNKYWKYQFGSEELLSNACSPYPYPDSLANEDIEMYKGDGYCTKLKEFVWNEVFEFVSNWKNMVKNNDHIKIGPFSIDRGTLATYNSSDKLRLMIQDLECEPGIDQVGGKIAMVSAVLRVIQKSEYLYTEEMRTGLSTMTLSAEGRWDSSHGQLCMVGCLGPPGAISHGCNSRITLYFPLTFNIKQRSTVVGTISSIDDGSESHTSHIFQSLTTPERFMNMHQCCGNLNWSYTYSKIMQAREFQRRSQPSNFEINWRKTFFHYPASKGDDIASLSSLADELSVEVCAVPRTWTDSQASKARVEIMLLSMGSFFGRYGPRYYEEKLDLDEALASSSRTFKEIEISGHLSITGSQFYNTSIFFEGLYDPAVGQMYLIGCRDVEEFQDCLIEIKVEYSPENTRWLLNPKIKLTIYSSRSKEDPLYIHPVSIDTFLYSNRKAYDRENVMVRKAVEDGLRILLLAMAILFIRGQCHYSESQGHPTAYISLVMLGLHILGFSIPLIMGNEVFLEWIEFASVKRGISEFQRLQLFRALHYFINILLLVAFLEARDLLKRVLNSRQVENNSRVNLLNIRIPSDKSVFLFSSIIHIIGFFIFHTLRKIYEFPLLLESEKYTLSLNDKRLQKWWTELGNYGGIVQDFFLLPQIIGNVVWGVQGKPLRKPYYIGYTMIRLVIQAYKYVRDPVSYSGSDSQFQYLRVVSYYKLGNLIVSAIVVTLAVTIYIQQENGYWKVMPARKPKECDKLDSKPEYSYERLLSD